MLQLRRYPTRHKLLLALDGVIFTADAETCRIIRIKNGLLPRMDRNDGLIIPIMLWQLVRNLKPRALSATKICAVGRSVGASAGSDRRRQRRSATSFTKN